LQIYKIFLPLEPQLSVKIGLCGTRVTVYTLVELLMIILFSFWNTNNIIFVASLKAKHKYQKMILSLFYCGRQKFILGYLQK